MVSVSARISISTNCLVRLLKREVGGGARNASERFVSARQAPVRASYFALAVNDSGCFSFKKNKKSCQVWPRNTPKRQFYIEKSNNHSTSHRPHTRAHTHAHGLSRPYLKTREDEDEKSQQHGTPVGARGESCEKRRRETPRGARPWGAHGRCVRPSRRACTTKRPTALAASRPCRIGHLLSPNKSKFAPGPTRGWEQVPPPLFLVVPRPRQQPPPRSLTSSARSGASASG